MYLGRRGEGDGGRCRGQKARTTGTEGERGRKGERGEGRERGRERDGKEEGGRKRREVNTKSGGTGAFE
jgi:hypothetical protein